MSKGARSLRYYVLRRIIEAFPLIIVVILINFTLIHSAPGDPVTVMAGEFPPPELIARVKSEFGLDKPLYEQFFIYLQNVLKGNLGYSYFYRQPVITVILERAPATLLLMLAQLVLAAVAGTALGVIGARKPYSKIDSAISTAALVGYCLPIFWLGIVLLLIFSIYLGLFPASGMQSLGVDMNPIERVLDIFQHLALPVFALGLNHIALIYRLTRSSMLEVLRMDFITTALVKGLKEREVLYKHALRNALLPVLTVVGMSVGTMIGGAVLTETVFGWPGIGRLLYDSIYARDYPLIMGIFVIVSISVIVANLVTDMLCAHLDPRIRYR